MAVFPLGNTNFKTKLSIIVSKFVRGNRATSSLLFFFWDTVESEHEKRGHAPNLFSYFVINLHNFTFSLSARGSEERRTTACGLKNSPTQPALKRWVSNLDAIVLRPFFELLLSMKVNKIINRKFSFLKIYLKTQMFLYSNEIRFTLQRNVSVTQLKFLIDAMKLTQQSCVQSERVFSKICVNLTTIRLKRQ